MSLSSVKSPPDALPLSVNGSHSPLPEQPLVVIGPQSGRLVTLLRDLWAYRELLGFLVWRDVKVRYKQTALGALWEIMQPLSTMLIATIFFGKLAKLEHQTGGVPYPLFVYAGLLPWTYFANALQNGGNSLVANANLMTKVFFPRLLLPAATVVAGLVDLLIAFVLLAFLMLYYRVTPGPGLLMLPVLVFLVALLATAVGAGLAGVAVRYRDVRYALPLLVQSWMLLSPVIWPPQIVPAPLRPYLALNPVTGLINGFRSALLNRPFAWSEIAVSALLSLLLLALSVRWFRRLEVSFADHI